MGPIAVERFPSLTLQLLAFYRRGYLVDLSHRRSTVMGFASQSNVVNPARQNVCIAVTGKYTVHTQTGRTFIIPGTVQRLRILLLARKNVLPSWVQNRKVVAIKSSRKRSTVVGFFLTPKVRTTTTTTTTTR